MTWPGPLPEAVGLAALVAMSAPPAQAQHGHATPPPVPDTARGLSPDPQTGYILEEVGDGLFWIGNGSYMAMLMVGPEGVALVDAPPSLDGLMQAAIAEATGDRAVTHLIYSHLHGDHIGAAGRFAGATIIAHADTARLLERGRPCTDCVDIADPRPAPDVTFEESYRLDLGGGQILQLDDHGPNHSEGNIFIHAPNHRALMLVDVAYPGWVPFDLLAVSSDIPGWIDAFDRILDYEFDAFVGGHLARTGTRADIEDNRAYVADVIAAATRALEDNPRAEVIPPLGREFGFENGWWLVDQHTRAVVAQCADEVIAAWQGRLGGVETYAESHCARMQFSLRID
ncbi:MAG: MBL fold metallo-hydrolase [Pseudomonadota bacterium]